MKIFLSLVFFSLLTRSVCKSRLFVFNSKLKKLDLREKFSKFSSESSISYSSKLKEIPLAHSSAHWMPINDCIDSLTSSYEYGLKSEDAERRLKIYGNNELQKPKQKTLTKLFFEQFDDRLVQILLSVAFLSSILAAFEKNIHAFTEPIVISSILIINAMVSIWQTKSAENSLEALKKLQPEYCKVLRDGSWIDNFPSTKLVPGDIISLRVGDKVPADSRILKIISNTFSTDEGSLTGESKTVIKTENTVHVKSSISEKINMLFSGTVVTFGSCHAIVARTGIDTEIGSINSGVQYAMERSTKTPLSQNLDEFGNHLSSIIGVICISIWLISIPKFKNEAFGSWTKGAIYHAKSAVALGVAAIPEGLPAVITLCLALGTRKMAKRNVIVRKLASVETLGCTSVICTDKTGTLTTNMMTVKTLLTVGNKIKAPNHLSFNERSVEGVSYDPIGKIDNFTSDNMNSPTFQMIATIASVCNEAAIEYKNGKFERLGEPTEAALKVLTEKMQNHMPGKLNESNSFKANQFSKFWNEKYKKLLTLEFTRDRKSMSVLVKPLIEENRSNILLVKGASELLLSRCKYIQEEDGNILEITPSIRKMLQEEISNVSKRPLRCLAFAYKSGEPLGILEKINTAEEAKDLPFTKDLSSYQEVEKDLTLVGFAGIKDPSRPEVFESIKKCERAGIRIIMITGDAKDTAVAIGKEVGIFKPNEDTSNSAFTSQEFFTLPYEYQLRLLKEGNKIFCRTEPKDKQKLITMLEKLGEVTAMTGDGVNDAPALQQADIGIAMGITGTEVSKGAADMILADDNFASIVDAVEEGRNIFSNMQSFISFLISSNIGEIFTILFSTLVGLPEPLSPLHLLWINLVTDGPPATALGFNPPEPGSMNKKPRLKSESILSKWLLVRYLITGVFASLATIGSFIWWYIDKGVSFGQLINWTKCPSWKHFAHSGKAPFWPVNPCSIFNGDDLKVPQTMALSVLVSIELLKALSAVSLNSSLFKVQPWKNPWLIPSVILPFILHVLVLNTPVLSSLFRLSPLTLRDWKVVFALSVPILFLEEALKLIGRRIHKSRTKTYESRDNTFP